MDKYCEKCKENSLNQEYICTLCGRDYSDGLIESNPNYTVDKAGYSVQDGTYISYYSVGTKKYNSDQKLARQLSRCCDLLKEFPFIEGAKANNVKSLISNWINRRLLNKSTSKILVTAAVHVHYDSIDMKTLSSYLNVQPMEVVKFLKNESVNNSNFSLRHPLNVNDYLKKGLLRLTANTYPLINELLEECIKIYEILNEMDYCEGKNPNIIASAIARIVCSINIKGKIYKISDIISAFDTNSKTVKLRYSDIIKNFRKLLVHLPWFNSDCSENDVLKEIPYIIKNGNTLVKVYQLSLSPSNNNNTTTTTITSSTTENNNNNNKSTIKSLTLYENPVITTPSISTPPPPPSTQQQQQPNPIQDLENIENSPKPTDFSILNNKSIDITKNYSISSETNVLVQNESMEISFAQPKTPSTSESKKHKLIRETPTPRLSKKTCIRKDYKNNGEDKKRKSVQPRRSSNRVLTSEKKKKTGK